MSDINEKVRRLIAKAKETGDADLLDLAMDLLDQVPVETPEPTPVKTVQKVDDQFAEFSMNKVNDKLPKPVEVKSRTNTFVDDGSEHSDVITPEIARAERRRPAFKKTEQTCSRCSKIVEVHPQHAREFFVCDRCLRR
jgi:formamidopyrimidine-DNA glycosylase